MYKDKKISVKSYHDVLKTPILLTMDILSFTCISQNEAMTSVHGGFPRKAGIQTKLSEM